MSDKVKVEYSDTPAKVAKALLDAAEKLDLDAGVVETTSDGVFVVPQEVAEEAGIEFEEAEGADDGPNDYSDLKGKALDAELEARGIPVEGKVAEKRKALIDYDAAQDAGADSEVE